MDVAELAPGLWRWTAPHPEWTPDQGGPDGWEAEVASYYCEAGGDVVLIDPLVPADGDDRVRFWRALDRDLARLTPHVVLTCAWHARSTGEILERYPGSRLWSPGTGLDELPDGLVASDPFGSGISGSGTTLPGGLVAISATTADEGVEVLLWLPAHAALVAGDVLLGDGPGAVRVCPDPWLDGADPAAVRAALRSRLLGLPVERLLVTHGEPVLEGVREALERALARV